jgi:hypothetical protein
VPARAGEIQRTVGDPAAAALRLGWRAERSIETGLDETLAAGG